MTERPLVTPPPSPDPDPAVAAGSGDDPVAPAAEVAVPASEQTAAAEPTLPAEAGGSAAEAAGTGGSAAGAAGAGGSAAEAAGTAGTAGSAAGAAGAAAAPTKPRRFAGAGRRLTLVTGLIHLPRTRRGLAAMLLIFGGLGAASVFGAASVIGWTETADFCGRCHQMGPELAGYNAGAHREVACAECHVEPGVGGFIKAKINGTRQLIEVITGTFPTPVPPPDHAMLPGYADTCLRCHSIDRLATSGVKTKVQFSEDEANTRQFVGLLIRPGGGDVGNVDRSVHWHVLQKVHYIAATPTAQKIDYVQVDRADGTTDEFIAQDQVHMVDNVAPDLKRISQEGPLRTMDCLDCHNRVGHPIPNPRVGVDNEMAAGTLDPTLPYLKRQAMYLLKGDYPTQAAADSAIASLRDFYKLNYPAVAQAKSAQIDTAVTELQHLYRLTATPEMKVSAKTYPDNLGHMDFVGCFRCHDGGHFQIVNNAVTRKAIPSTCDTCHTFPQIGKATASLPYGAPPATHADSLYVFNHSKVAKGIDPGTQSCGECHARDYCANCHDTGAINVKHDDMLLNHAKVARDDGTTACAYCHQPVYCARCHNEPVLPTGGALVPAPGTPVGASPTPVPAGPGASPALESPSGTPGQAPGSPAPTPDLPYPSPEPPSPSPSEAPTSLRWPLLP